MIPMKITKKKKKKSDSDDEDLHMEIRRKSKRSRVVLSESDDSDSEDHSIRKSRPCTISQIPEMEDEIARHVPEQKQIDILAREAMRVKIAKSTSKARQNQDLVPQNECLEQLMGSKTERNVETVQIERNQKMQKVIISVETLDTYIKDEEKCIKDLLQEIESRKRKIIEFQTVKSYLV